MGSRFIAHRVPPWHDRFLTGPKKQKVVCGICVTHGPATADRGHALCRLPIDPQLHGTDRRLARCQLPIGSRARCTSKRVVWCRIPAELDRTHGPCQAPIGPSPRAGQPLAGTYGTA
jgi:hypothetical protein